MLQLFAQSSRLNFRFLEFLFYCVPISALLLVLVFPQSAMASFLRCDGYLIKQGVSQERVLAKCDVFLNKVSLSQIFRTEFSDSRQEKSFSKGYQMILAEPGSTRLYLVETLNGNVKNVDSTGFTQADLPGLRSEICGFSNQISNQIPNLKWFFHRSEAEVLAVCGMPGERAVTDESERLISTFKAGQGQTTRFQVLKTEEFLYPLHDGQTLKLELTESKVVRAEILMP